MWGSISEMLRYSAIQLTGDCGLLAPYFGILANGSTHEPAVEHMAGQVGTRITMPAGPRFPSTCGSKMFVSLVSFAVSLIALAGAPPTAVERPEEGRVALDPYLPLTRDCNRGLRLR